MNTKPMQICRKPELSHYSRVCFLQDNRVARYRHGCSCPSVTGRPQISLRGCLSLTVGPERKAAAPQGGTVENTAAPGLRPWPCRLLACSEQLPPRGGFSDFHFFRFSFPWHFMDTSTLTFRLHQKIHGYSSVRALCVQIYTS